MSEPMNQGGILPINELHEFLWERLALISETEPKFLQNQLAEYRRKAVIRLASLIPMLGAILFQRATRFVFLGNKYSHLISDLPRDQVSLIGGSETYALARRLRMRFVPVVSLALLLWLDHKSDRRVFLRLARAAMRAYFRRASPKCLILDHDVLPIDRLLTAVAREADTRVIVIAHGLYQSKSPQSLIDGQVADAVLVYDEHQSDIFKRAGARLPIVMGFHSNIARRALAGNAGEVCFIGQPWGRHYGIECARRYEKVLTSFVEALRLRKAAVYYKPHQLEADDEDKLKSAGVDIFPGSLEEAFERFDYFFSVASTALFEATLAGKVSVQLFDPAFNCDRFDQFGYAHVVDAYDKEAISGFQRLEPIVALDLHYKEVGKRFWDVMSQLALDAC